MLLVEACLLMPSWLHDPLVDVAGGSPTLLRSVRWLNAEGRFIAAKEGFEKFGRVRSEKTREEVSGRIGLNLAKFSNI